MNTGETRKQGYREPTTLEAAFVMGSMVVLLVLASLYQLRFEMILLGVAMIAGAVAMFRLGMPWSELENAASLRIKTATPTLYMIWKTGILVAALIFSGSVPMLVYYGIKWINPQFIYINSFLICIVMSMATGSSWSAAGTVGLAMFGVGMGMGASLPTIVGAIISGSIFGDKMSPLSETTNMAPACAGTTLYTHIRSMFWTTIPASLIAAVVFIIAGMQMDITASAVLEKAAPLLNDMERLYSFNLILLLPFVFIIYAAATKKPPIPVMAVTILISLALGVFYQGFSLERSLYSALNGFQISYIAPEGFKPTEDMIRLLQRGGARSMAGVIIMCFCGFMAAAVIAKAHFLEVLLGDLNTTLNSRVKTMAATMGTLILIMFATGNAYVAFIMVPEMFKRAFLQNDMGVPALSRSLEDIGTCWGCLIPWSLSGAYYSGLFGLPIYGEGGYVQWLVMSYLMPVIALALTALNLGMYAPSPAEKKSLIAEIDELAGRGNARA
jgi:NhaC family Na+:H+ antiporter